MGQSNTGILSARVRHIAGRSQLRESCCARIRLGRHEFLAGERLQRLPHGRHKLYLQTFPSRTQPRNTSTVYSTASTARKSTTISQKYTIVSSVTTRDAFTVGESPGIAEPSQAIPYLKCGIPLQVIFHFEHMYIDHAPGKSCFHARTWKLTELKNILGKFMIYIQDHDGWDSLYLENYDQPRILGRWANYTIYRVQAAKILAVFHATGRGTLFIYHGQEIGMANASWTVEELKDVEEINS